jgi:hypothetical protein
VPPVWLKQRLRLLHRYLPLGESCSKAEGHRVGVHRGALEAHRGVDKPKKRDVHRPLGVLLAERQELALPGKQDSGLFRVHLPSQQHRSELQAHAPHDELEALDDYRFLGVSHPLVEQLQVAAQELLLPVAKRSHEALIDPGLLVQERAKRERLLLLQARRRALDSQQRLGRLKDPPL